jgi:outer membrane protein assembly factor BamE (lipoprotein component of BamABCDE complex)
MQIGLVICILWSAALGEKHGRKNRTRYGLIRPHIKGINMARSRFGSTSRVASYATAVVVGSLMLSGCNSGISRTVTHGYVAEKYAIEQVPVGGSREQVELVLGTPSTTGNFGGQVWYYISQTSKQTAQFLKPKITDRRIVAVYFDKNEEVTQIQKYELKDGRVIAFNPNTTPSYGADYSFIQQVLSGGPKAQL